jgi:hypothetical protein
MLHQVLKYYGDQIKKNEMGWSCSIMGELLTEFWSECLEEEDHMGDLGVEGRIILKVDLN